MSNGHGLFISYAHDDDEDFVRQLYRDLTQSGLDVWWDREAMESRGRAFLQEIRDAITVVDRLILVIGPEAVQSDYVRAEWQLALGLCKVIVPILRLGDYDLAPIELRGLHCPDFRSSRPYREALDELIRVLGAPILPLGELHGLDTLPEHFLPRREQMAELTDAILADVIRPVAITSAKRTAALHGMGGIGKSVMAAALGRACETRRVFGDGIVWIKIGQHPPDFSRQMRLVGQALDDDQPQYYADLQSGQVRLARLLADKVCLLILDDVWDVRHAEPFVNALGPRCRLLITTRDSGLATALGAQEFRLDVLSDKQALEFLAEWVGQKATALPPEAGEVAKECGNLALALAMIGALVRGKPDRWENALHKLRQADLEQIARRLPNYEHPNLLRALQVSIQALADLEVQQRFPNIQARYLDFAVFPQGTPIPESVLGVFWAPEGLDRFQVQDVANFLVERSLAQRDERNRLKLHDLQFDYVRTQIPDLPARRRALLDAYAAQCPSGWPSGPNDGYFYEHLAYHLVQAGRGEELGDLLLNLEWLWAKLQATDVTAVLKDYDYLPDRPELRVVHEAIKRSAQILRQDRTQLAGQLLGRLLSRQEPGIRSLLEQASRWTGAAWLRPLTPTLTPPGDPLLLTLSGHEGTVRSLAVTPDGRWGITASPSPLDRTVRLWDLATGIELRALAGQADAGFNPVGMTPDGRWALCAQGSDIQVWNVATGEQACVMHGLSGRITALAVATERKRAISAADDGKLIVWDLDKWEEHAELPGSQERVYAVFITPDGRAAVSASPGILKLWDLERRLETSMRQVESGFHGAWQSSPWQHPPLALSPDGRRVFVGSPLHVWDVGSGDLLPIFTDSPGQVLSVTPDGRVALISQDNQTIDVWDVERMVRLVTLPGQRSPISTLALTPDGRTVVTALFDHYIKVWALEYRAKSVASPQPHDSVDVTRDGRWAVSVGEGKIVTVWDLDGQPVSPSPVRDSVVQEMHAIWQERAARRAQADELIRRYHSEPSRAEKAPEESEAKPAKPVVVVGIAEWKVIAANGQRALATLREGIKASEVEETGEPNERYAIEVWTFDAPDKPVILNGHSSPVTAVAITPDGRRAVSGCIGRTLRVWDLETGKELRTLRGHRGTVWDVQVTPDGRYLVSASEDRTVRVWSLATGRNVATFTGQLPIKSCAVGQDGRLIVACDSLGQVHLLRLQGQTGA